MYLPARHHLYGGHAGEEDMSDSICVSSAAAKQASDACRCLAARACTAAGHIEPLSAAVNAADPARCMAADEALAQHEAKQAELNEVPAWRWLPAAVAEHADAQRPQLHLSSNVLNLAAAQAAQRAVPGHVCTALADAGVECASVVDLVAALKARPALRPSPEGYPCSEAWLADKAACEELVSSWSLCRDAELTGDKASGFAASD